MLLVDWLPSTAVDGGCGGVGVVVVGGGVVSVVNCVVVVTLDVVIEANSGNFAAALIVLPTVAFVESVTILSGGQEKRVDIMKKIPKGCKVGRILTLRGGMLRGGSHDVMLELAFTLLP